MYVSRKSFNDLLNSSLLVSILQKEKKHVYIAGDFNVNTDPTLRGDGNTQTFNNILSSNFYFR